jgi:hypothetical protein
MKHFVFPINWKLSQVTSWHEILVYQNLLNFYVTMLVSCDRVLALEGNCFGVWIHTLIVMIYI